eukprot:NODE_92_length_21543_cov_0.719036.p17 type:complete len:119 gc:universal NODE_92_length_21543_cov_0.719036:12612-12968(+)
MDFKKNVEDLLNSERNEPFKISETSEKPTNIVVKYRKVHSKSSVAAPSADYLIYKDLRVKSLKESQIAKEIESETKSLEDFDSKRLAKASEDLKRTLVRKEKRRKKKFKALQRLKSNN